MAHVWAIMTFFRDLFPCINMTHHQSDGSKLDGGIVSPCVFLKMPLLIMTVSLLFSFPGMFFHHEIPQELLGKRNSSFSLSSKGSET